MPLFYMMVSVLTWSLFPLLSAWSIDKISVFDYIFWTYVVGLIGSYGWLRLMPGYKKMKLFTWRQLDGRIIAELFIGCCLTVVLSFACLLISFDHMSKASATVMYEIWPIIAMYITPLLIAKGWDKISTKDLAFSFLAFLGAAFLIYPEASGGAASFFTDLERLRYAFLPLLGGVFMAISSVMKLRVSHLLRNEEHPVASLLLVQVFVSVGVILVSIPFMAFWPDKQSVYTFDNIAAVLFIGLFISTLGTVTYTLAVLRSAKSNIVVLWYLMPIFSVIWLWLAGQSQITPYIVLGSVFIITSNLVITVRADRSLSYTAAVLMMLVCGVYAYFVEGLALDDYYQAISVPIVFYTILVAFMMDRLIRSDKLEEARAIEVINYIDGCANELRESAGFYIDHVVAIVSTNNAATVNRHYRIVRNADEPALAGIYNQFDELTTSKLQGTSFAEMFILLLVGTLIVVTSMVFRPADIVGDSFSVVLSLTVMFIFFTVFDLQNQRRKFYLERESNGHRSISSKVIGNMAGEQAISAVLIVMIMAAFLCLLAFKRYPALFA